MVKKLTFADIKKGTYFKLDYSDYDNIDMLNIRYTKFSCWYNDIDTILKKCDNKSVIIKDDSAFGVKNSKIIRTKLSQFLNTKVVIDQEDRVEVVKLVTIVI